MNGLPHETVSGIAGIDAAWVSYTDTEFDLGVSNNVTSVWDVRSVNRVRVALDSFERAPTGLSVKIQYSATGNGWADSGTAIVHGGVANGYAQTAELSVDSVAFIRLLVATAEGSETICAAHLYGYRT